MARDKDDLWRNFPKTAIEFDRRFATEEACRAYWIEARWAGEPACARCGGKRVWAERGGFLFECADCDHQTSLTSGTLLEKTRKPFKVWFRAVFEISSRRTDLHRAGVVRMQAGEDLQQRALAAARRPDQAGELARHDVEGRVRDRQVRLGALAVGLATPARWMKGSVALGVSAHARVGDDERRARGRDERRRAAIPIQVISITAMNIAAVSSVTCTCSIR